MPSVRMAVSCSLLLRLCTCHYRPSLDDSVVLADLFTRRKSSEINPALESLCSAIYGARLLTVKGTA